LRIDDVAERRVPSAPRDSIRPSPIVLVASSRVWGTSDSATLWAQFPNGKRPINFSLSVGSTVPSSVRLSRISGELADIFPHYRDFSFFVARQELVIVDSQSYGIVGFVPISGGDTVGVAPPREETGAVGTAAPPAPAKKKAVRTEKKRVTVTEENPRGIERETIRRGPTHTETDVTVGTSRRDIEELGEIPRDRRIGPPVRERFEHDEGPPFPFSLFFGRPN
jgi:hypothetical protein